MKAEPYLYIKGGYSKKIKFTREIGNTHPRAPIYPGMLRITGISPYIRVFPGVLWGYWPVIGGMPI